MCRVNSFACDELSQYTNSLLFDSGTEIASIDLTDKDGNRIDMCLLVAGEVKARRYGDDEWFQVPSKFPEDIRNAIRNNQWNLLDGDMSNNWFALDFTIYNNEGAVIAQDDEVFEEDIFKLTRKNMEADLTNTHGQARGVAET